MQAYPAPCVAQCLYGLTGLEDLRLNQNEIEYIHADVARLVNLRDLQVSSPSVSTSQVGAHK
jgi:Leucine-rich repeat (LRR) protein